MDALLERGLAPVPISLQKLDPPIEVGDQIPEELKRWLAQVVDILNQDLQTIEDAIP